MTDTSQGVGYIINNVKYPEFIRKHAVFSKLSKIKKIFPSIGLENCSENIEYTNFQQAIDNGTNMLYYSARTNLYGAAAKLPITSKLQSLVKSVWSEVSHNYYSMTTRDSSKKIIISMCQDIFDKDKNLIFKKGEGFFKVYRKLTEMLAEAGVALKSLDSCEYFKAFSSFNSPMTDCKLVFSSSGEEGAWDIATISMRGVASCQTWDKPQSRGLIGSISSRYVGVIYITSPAFKTEHGSRMIRRSMVRFCLHKQTKKPALLIDNIYPIHDTKELEIFSKFLTKKSGLEVIHAGMTQWHNYSLPNDPHYNFIPFKPEEMTYMDNKIPYMTNISSADIEKLYSGLVNAINHTNAACQNSVKNHIQSSLKEYAKNKNNVPTFKSGVPNLLSSLAKHGLSTNALMTPIKNPSFEDYKVLMKSNSNIGIEKKIIFDTLSSLQKKKNEIINNKASLGKWTKSYEKSFPKLVNIVVSQQRKALVSRFLEIVKYT